MAIDSNLVHVLLSKIAQFFRGLPMELTFGEFALIVDTLRASLSIVDSSYPLFKYDRGSRRAVLDKLMNDEGLKVRVEVVERGA